MGGWKHESKKPVTRVLDGITGWVYVGVGLVLLAVWVWGLRTGVHQ